MWWIKPWHDGTQKDYTHRTIIWFSAKSNMSKSFFVKNDTVLSYNFYPVSLTHRTYIKNNGHLWYDKKNTNSHYCFGIKNCYHITNTMILFFQLVSCHSHSKNNFLTFCLLFSISGKKLWTEVMHVVLIYFVSLQFLCNFFLMISI